MRLSEKDIQMFRQLSQGELGNQLQDYTKRLIDFIHDSRSWDKDDNRDTAKLAGSKLKEYFLDKIRPAQSTPKVGETYE